MERRVVMKKICITIIIFIIAGCASKQLRESVDGMYPRSPLMLVNIKGEDCRWTPDVIKVEKGTHVIMGVESVDWDYNFTLSDYNLRFDIPQGEKVFAEFYASKTGEFEFGCYIERGENFHWGGMVGKLIVE